MGKKGENRWCPAVERELSATECGENRVSRYACPPDCPHNPFAPGRYDPFQTLEGKVDRKAMVQCEERVEDPRAFAAGLEQVRLSSDPSALPAFYQWHLFFATGAGGLTCARRWEGSGFPGLRNDERVLLRAKMKTRVALLEIHRVLDEKRVQAVDLLAAEPAPMLVFDRSLASAATRFAVILSWVYPLPHYWRLSGSAILMPEFAQLEPLEIVTETVRHLGGPTEERGMRLWLAEHFVLFGEALEASGVARRRQLLAGIDARFGKAVYELRVPFAECLDRLDRVTGVEPDCLEDDERGQGFAEARIWLEQPSSEQQRMPPTHGTPVLGRVLLGQSHWRLEAFGGKRLAELRRQFEARLDRCVRFAGERLDDLAGRMAAKEPRVADHLVPPPLLADPVNLSMVSSVLPPTADDLPPHEAAARFFHEADRAFLDERVPALDDRTPREAAVDPKLRPRLVHLLKQRVRALDARNLKTGRRDDINWLLRELGTTEILFEPPPPRPVPPDPDPRETLDDPPAPTDGVGVNADLLPPAPSLPAEPLELEEAAARLGRALEQFDSAEEAMEELDASGAAMLDDAADLTEEFLDDETFPLLVPLLLQAWFALVPPGCRAPTIDYDTLAKTFSHQLAGLNRSLNRPTLAGLMKQLGKGSQPALTQLLTAQLLEASTKAPKDLRPPLEAVPAMLAMLNTVVECLDASLRSPG